MCQALAGVSVRHAPGLMGYCNRGTVAIVSEAPMHLGVGVQGVLLTSCSHSFPCCPMDLQSLTGVSGWGSPWRDRLHVLGSDTPGAALSQ